MTTQELKQHIDKVLGNNIRCLLPSYWWKRLFNQVADRVDEVEQSTTQLIDSKIEEVKMPIVESVDELSKLNLPKGGVAAVEKVGEPVVVNLEDCYLSADAATDWDKYTVIRGFSEKGAPSNAVGQIHLYSDKSMENGLTIACGEGKYFYYKIVNGRRYDSSLEEVNKYLASGKYRLVFGYYIENISAYVTLYSAFPQPSLYIKGDFWEKLSKEYVVSSEEELNALSVDNGTIAKVARELKQINRANCHTVIKFSDIPANWDKFTRVDKVEHIGGNTSSSCGINLAHYDGHAYVVLRINFVGYMTYVASVYVDSTLTNEVSITKTEVDVKLQEYDFRYIGPTFTMGEPYIDSTFALYEKDVSADAYIKGETWTRLLKEGDVTGGGSVIFSIPLSGDITDITENQRNRNIESYQKVIKAFEDNIVLDIKIDQLFISNVSLYVIDVNNNIVAMVFNRDNSVYTYRFSSDGNFTREIEEGSALEIDSELSDTSENPVQNKVVKAYVDEQIAAIGEGVEFREFYISSDSFANVEGELTEQQKAYNIETVELVKRGKAVVLFGPSGTKLYCCAFGSGAEAGSSSFTFQYAHFYLYSLIVDKDGNVTLEVNYKMWLDSELSETSGNAIQNKVVTSALNSKADKSDIKTINGVSLLGGGDITISGGGVSEDYVNTAIANAITNTLNTEV